MNISFEGFMVRIFYLLFFLTFVLAQQTLEDSLHLLQEKLAYTQTNIEKTPENPRSETEKELAELKARIKDLQQQINRLKQFQLSGFIDVEYSNFGTEHSSLLPLITGTSTFSNSHLNIYMSSKVSDIIHVFSEIRYLYKPNLDFIEENVYQRHGGSINIERAWIRWHIDDKYQFKFGKFLVPYGIWNLDHGSPILLSTRTPMVLRKQLFPEYIVGVQFLGHMYIGDDELDYFAWIGNNKGETQYEQDDFDEKAMGFRLRYSFDILDQFAIGVSGYMGKVIEPQFHMTNETMYHAQSIFLAENELSYSSHAVDSVFVKETMSALSKTRLPAIISGGFNPRGEPLTSYKERALGVDLSIEYEGFGLQGEYILNHITATDHISPSVMLFRNQEKKTSSHSHSHEGSSSLDLEHVSTITLNEVTPKPFYERGSYLQLFYNTELFEYDFTPFIRYGTSDPNDLFTHEISELNLVTLGLNIKPSPSWVFKLEYHIHTFHEQKRNFNMFTASTSVAF